MRSSRSPREFPEIQIILGLSNISFGLNPAARHVLNSVFLDHAQRRGLTGAILHSSKIMPLHKIAEEEVRVAEDLIFDRRRAGYDPLQAFMALFADRQAAAVKKERPAAVEERLKQRIVDGDRQGLEADLDEALGRYPPLDIINIHLLAGMKVVGDLFGAGKMQLPFVLQSAETMKAAVAHLEPHMERVEGSHKGTVVVATVKGDVHDIGKNLVDIILTNNGYKVVNLGIKQPLANILAAAQEHRAHAIGMSGLLVKSTVIMRENMVEMTRQGLEIPVMLGGAALTRQYVETDCVQAYASGRVAYARDAFDGLHLMDRIVSGCFPTYLAERQAKQQARPKRDRPERRLAAGGEAPPLRPVEVEETRLRRNELSRGIEVPRPPFWGAQVIEEVPVKALVPYLNENMLYQFHWGFKKDGRSLDQFLAWAQKELRPILGGLIEQAEAERVFAPQAVYGYWPAAGDGNDVVLFDPADPAREVARFSLPRQAKKNGLCIADFLRDSAEPGRDVIGLQVVTIGQRASEVAREWFAANRYNDYVRLHGLGVELAEALAEYVHKRIRAELGFSHLDARDRHELLKQGYRGSRYSFGYPACPNLADQRPLLALLDAARIGVELAEEDQLHPEQRPARSSSTTPRRATSTSERLCCGSSVLPWGLALEDGVEDDQELTHGGGDGDLGGLAAGDEARIEGADRGIAADGGEGRHVQGLADAGAAAEDHAPAAEGAAVAVDRGDTDEAGDLAPIEGAELGQLGEERAGRGLADARDRGEQVLGGAPGGAAAHGVVEIGLDLAQLLLQPGQVGVEPPDEPRVAELAAALALAADHLDQLAAAGDQLAERARRRVGHRPWFGPDRFGEAGDGLGIEPIGLGEPAGGAGEVPDLAGIDHGQRQLCGAERGGHRHLEAAGRFEHHQLWRDRRQALDQSGETGTIPADREGLAGWPQMHIEPVLGDVDPDEGRHGRGMLHDPSLRIRARRSAAQATVRVRELPGGRGAELRHGLAHPRPKRAPVRPQGRRARRPRQLRHTRSPAATRRTGSRGDAPSRRPSLAIAPRLVTFAHDHDDRRALRGAPRSPRAGG